MLRECLICRVSMCRYGVVLVLSSGSRSDCLVVEKILVVVAYELER